jgi:hypothetical protein
LLTNLPKEHSEKLIFDLCSCFGKVRRVEIILENELFEGSAFVDFETEHEA